MKTSRKSTALARADAASSARVRSPSWGFSRTSSIVRTARTRTYWRKEERPGWMPPNDTLSRAPPPFAVPRNSSTPCHRASLVDGDGAIIPRQFFSDPGSLCAASPRNFHLFLSSSFHNHPSQPFSPFLVPPVRALVPAPRPAHVLLRSALPPRGGRKRKQGEGVAVSSVGRGAREGSATKREEPSNGTISDERSLRVETRGRFPAGGSFFGETGGGGGMPSCRLCFCPLFLFVALQLTTLLLLRKRAAQGRRKREESEREEREDSRDKAASSCW